VLPCCSNTSNVLAGASNEEVGSDSRVLHLAWEMWIFLFGERDSVRSVKAETGRVSVSMREVRLCLTFSPPWPSPDTQPKRQVGASDVTEVLEIEIS